MKFRSLAPMLAAAVALMAGLGITPAFAGKEVRTEVRRETDSPDDDAFDLDGQWTLDTRKDGLVRVTFKIARRGMLNWNSITVPFAKLLGLTADEITGPSKAVTFRLQRDAATFVCEGRAARGKGAGLFEVQIDPTFVAGFRKRGLATPSHGQQAELALGDVGLELVDEMLSRGAKLDVGQLVRMAQHGVGLDYVRGLEELGYAPKTVDELVEARDHGVDLAFARGFQEAGYGKLPMRTLIEARDHGVDPEYVQGLATHGYKDLELDQLIEARDHGVDPKYVGAMREAGYSGGLHQLIEARDHGVDPGFVAGMMEAGHKRDSLEELIRARDHGVDGNYALGLAQAGYPGLTLDQLIEARNHGVDAKFARQIREKLRETPSIERLIHLRDRGGLD